MELFDSKGQWRGNAITDQEVAAENFTPERAALWQQLKTVSAQVLDGSSLERECQHRVNEAERAFKLKTARLNTMRPKRTFRDEWAAMRNAG